MFKKRKHMLKFLGSSILLIIFLAYLLYNIESERIFNIVNVFSLSTGFISFFVSIYIINYTDDIRAELNIRNNKDKTKKYLEKEFCKEYKENIKVIINFYSAFNNSQIDQIIFLKNDAYTILNKYEIILDKSSKGIVDLNQYIHKLKNENFDKQIEKGRNIESFTSNTMRIQTIFKVLFEDLQN